MATAACRCPMAALLSPPAQGLRAIPEARAEMDSLLASTPLLCYPLLPPGPAALRTTRAPAGGWSTLPLGLHPCVPVGHGHGCLVRATSLCGSL